MTTITVGTTRMHSGVFRFALGLAVGATFLLLAGPWGADSVPPVPPPFGAPGTGGDPGHGLQLYREYDCVRCHAEPRTRNPINAPTSLGIAGSRAPATWMADYIRNPEPIRYAREGIRPGLRMPSFPLTENEAMDLAAFLALQKDSLRIPPRPDLMMLAHEPDVVQVGALLFAEYQCQGCHRLAGRGTEIGPALDTVGARRTAGYIAALLGDPDRVVPGTAMKNHDLWDEELNALTAFLLSRGAP